VFAKILEKAFYTRVMLFLTKHSLINKNQHGFLKSKSTSTATAAYVQDVLQALNRHEDTLGVFYDFSRAFDTIDHELLLSKLKSLGIRGIAGAWIKSYLTDRSQVVSIVNNGSEAKSTVSSLNIGIPQGGTLSPLLFILFTNDISDHATIGKLTLFADDTSQLISSAVENASVIANMAVTQILKWSENNQLVINESKTVILKFKANHRPSHSSPLIKMSTKSLPVKSETKFLGIIIDDTLKWASHINYTCRKVASGCYLIKKLMEVSTLMAARLVYFACIESRLRYGIILWGDATNVNRLFKLQKRAIRLMAKASTNPCAEIWTKDSCRSLFKSQKVLTLAGLYILNVILYATNQDIYTATHADSHNYKTRQNYNLLLEKPCLNMFKKGPIYVGCKLYNALPKHLQIKSERQFKAKLQSYLLDECFYNVNEFLLNRNR
jgi:hypothetical protein